jgi:hypothetical protein
MTTVKVHFPTANGFILVSVGERNHTEHRTRISPLSPVFNIELIVLLTLWFSSHTCYTWTWTHTYMLTQTPYYGVERVLDPDEIVNWCYLVWIVKIRGVGSTLEVNGLRYNAHAPNRKRTVVGRVLGPMNSSILDKGNRRRLQCPVHWHHRYVEGPCLSITGDHVKFSDMSDGIYDSDKALWYVTEAIPTRRDKRRKRGDENNIEKDNAQCPCPDACQHP